MAQSINLLMELFNKHLVIKKSNRKLFGNKRKNILNCGLDPFDDLKVMKKLIKNY